ncbi:MAG: hypothetical protein EZS28_030254, partial [Streblomastix strix]
IRITMDSKPEMSQKVEAVDHTEEEDIIIKEEDRVIRIETNRIKKDTRKHRNIILIRNRPSTRQKNPINWYRTHQFEDKNREEGWDDNPNDDWTKRTQMQKDPPNNRSDRDSTWAEDEVPQHQVSTPQSKQPAQQIQRVQQIQVQPKQQAPAQIPKQRVRTIQQPSQDDIEEREVIQERLAALQKEKENLGISDSDMEWRQLIAAIDSNNNLTPRNLNIELDLDKNQRKLRENQKY